MFRDYVSTYDEMRKIAKANGLSKSDLKRLGIDVADYRSAYAYELKRTAKLRDRFAPMRMLAELRWYDLKRPYFNVYPVIEQKLVDVNKDVQLEQLRLPFKTLEVRTYSQTMLLADCGEVFLMVIEGKGMAYQEFVMAKKGTVGQIRHADYRQVNTDWPMKSEFQVSKESRERAAILASAVCLVAKDPSIVVPVMFGADADRTLTESESAMMAARAVRKTGRVGFEVGLEVERNKASVHYRNGCFAKYHVGKDHPQYPGGESLMPIIKWRNGCVVNKENTPVVPTGFHDEALTK